VERKTPNSGELTSDCGEPQAEPLRPISRAACQIWLKAFTASGLASVSVVSGASRISLRNLSKVVKADKTAEARAEVEALSREAERLETESGLLDNQLAETRQALNRALEDATTARQEAKEERAAVAAEQAKVAELLIQIADLQRVLGDEKGGMRRGAARYVRNPSTRIQSHR
jgi:hypothetical protein